MCVCTQVRTYPICAVVASDIEIVSSCSFKMCAVVPCVFMCMCMCICVQWYMYMFYFYIEMCGMCSALTPSVPWLLAILKYLSSCSLKMCAVVRPLSPLAISPSSNKTTESPVCLRVVHCVSVPLKNTTHIHHTQTFQPTYMQWLDSPYPTHKHTLTIRHMSLYTKTNTTHKNTPHTQTNLGQRACRQWLDQPYPRPPHTRHMFHQFWETGMRGVGFSWAI